MKKTVLVLSCVVVSACSGTFPIEEVVMGDAIRELDSGGEAPSEPRIDAEVVVSIHVPPEGLLVVNSSESIRHYDTIPDASTDLQGPERDAFFQTLYRGLADSQGTNYAFQLIDMGPALAVALERHLGRHFRSVRLNVVPDLTLAEVGSFVIGVGGHADIFFTKSATIELITEAGPVQLPPFEGRGERRTGRHLGWAIPVVLIGGLIVGSLIVSPIIRAITRRHIRESWAVALDGAAAGWAEGVANAWRSQNGFPELQQPVVAPPVIAVAPPPSAPVVCDANARCDSGFICHEGMCLSACNPDCALNEVCTGSGECVSACNPPCQPGTVCTAQRECHAP